MLERKDNEEDTGQRNSIRLPQLLITLALTWMSALHMVMWMQLMKLAAYVLAAGNMRTTIVNKRPGLGELTSGPRQQSTG